jgi:hypothetical protein
MKTIKRNIIKEKKYLINIENEISKDYIIQLEDKLNNIIKTKSLQDKIKNNNKPKEV